MTRNKLYLIMGIACIAGYIWLLTSYSRFLGIQTPEIGMCLFRKLTNFPCPSCGTTHSVIALINGSLKDALLLNPFGLIVTGILLIIPIWICYDLAMKSNSLYKTYVKFETIFQYKLISIIGIILVLLNWAWNIIKYY